MELPYVIVFEPPSRAELRALLRNAWLWVVVGLSLAVAIGLVVLVVSVSRAEALASGVTADIHVSSRPAGAEIALDGQRVGRTPAVLGVPLGPHRVQLKLPNFLETTHSVEVLRGGAELDVTLWRTQPVLSRVRASLPGAIVTSATLIPDGRLDLTLGVGAKDELQAWRLDPRVGVRDALVSGLWAGRLAMTSDGSRAAYAGPEIGPSPQNLRRESNVVLWLLSTSQANAGPVARWHAPAGEALVDVTWVPGERSLLGVTARDKTLDRDIRSRVWLIDSDSGAARLLLNVPSHITPGAYVWSPDGQHVALLAHAGTLNALCLLSLDGEFRYLADLEPVAGAPLAYPPLAWSGDSGQFAFAAPRQEPFMMPAGWLESDQRRAVYASSVGAPSPRLVAEIESQSLTWRDDGQILVLSRGRDTTLRLESIDSDGQRRSLLDVPLRAAVYAAQWDLAHAQALIASRSGSEIEYWLLRLGLEDQP